MKIRCTILALLFFVLILQSCKPQKQKETIVIITTEFGNMKIKLYNETPLHRDNFINLIKKGYFTNKIFERVIKDFMIQGGSSSDSVINDPNPETAYTYTIPAEFNPKFYHKKGALAAARKSDFVNPNRESTPTQFYIVQGSKFTDEQLNQVENGINTQMIQLQAKIYYQQSVKKLQLSGESYSDQTIIQQAISKASEENSKKPFKFSDEQRQTYKTIGGAPHLDGTYTVFGEVIEGLNIVDSIAKVKTNAKDKPLKEIKFSVKIQE
ncbi:MAG TPA: peptidylprolyl isomerase [Bacteroidales bacterium]